MKYVLKLLEFEHGPLLVQIRSVIHPEMIITALAENEKEGAALLAELETAVEPDREQP